MYFRSIRKKTALLSALLVIAMIFSVLCLPVSDCGTGKVYAEAEPGQVTDDPGQETIDPNQGSGNSESGNNDQNTADPGQNNEDPNPGGDEPGTDIDEPTEPEKPVMPDNYTGIWEDKYYRGGKLWTGWVTNGKYKYYYESGISVTGRKKIGKKQYYFNDDGVLMKGTVKTSKVIYYTNKKTGVIYGIRLRTPALCQRPKLPTGCEIVSWTMMANYAGVKISKIKAAKVMPKNRNPNKGFSGSPFRTRGGGMVVWPPGLMKMTGKYLGSAVNMTGSSMTRLQNKLLSGHVVCVWVRGLDGFMSHTIAVTGYDKKRIYYNDPWTGKASSMKRKTFLKKWKRHRRRALSW